ncbi:hypothetical protein EDB85DRAFT_2280607 [Lactarius pseudohatsudake]|nr:hypothetical protein EDB85DRAFT_2280607 [Lactarius pseudohatsudake]
MLSPSLTKTLIGLPPTTFSGNRAESRAFLTQFKLFRRLNHDHSFMTFPYLRVELALSYIQGPTVNPWRSSVRRNLTAGPTDEALWDEFVDNTPPTSPVPDDDGVIDLTDSDLDEWDPPALRYEPYTRPAETPVSSLSACIADSVTDANGTDDEEDCSIIENTPILSSPVPPVPPMRPASIVADNDSLSEGVTSLITPISPSATALALPDTVAHVAVRPTKKRKRDTNGEDDTRSCRRIRAQLARRPVILPPPVNDSSGRPGTNVTSLSPPASRSPTPIPAPLSPRTVVATVDNTPLVTSVALLGLSAICDDRQSPSLPAIVDFTLDTFDNAPDAVLVASPSPSQSPVSAPLPPLALPSLSPPPFQSSRVVEDANVLVKGVKTSATSVLTADIAPPQPPVSYYPPVFLPRAFERPRDPDEVAPATQQHFSRRPRTSATGTTSHPQNSEVPRKRDGHAYTAQRTIEPGELAKQTARHVSPFQNTSSITSPRHSLKRSRDLDKLEYVHAQPQPARSRRAPRPADRCINDEQPPDAFVKQVDMFLKNYDTTRTVPKPTPTEDDRTYDAVAQHLDRWLWMTDRTTKANDAEPQYPNRLTRSKNNLELTVRTTYAGCEYATHSRAKNDTATSRKDEAEQKSFEDELVKRGACCKLPPLSIIRKVLYYSKYCAPLGSSRVSLQLGIKPELCLKNLKLRHLGASPSPDRKI